MTALLLALPRLSADLGATNVQQLWISDSYGFMVAGPVITMGTLGDRIGRRWLLMIGGAVFAVLSVVAAFAVSPLLLIAMAGTGLLVTQYLQSVLGFSPVASAVLFAPMGLGVPVGTMAAPALARRMKQTTAIASGLMWSALGTGPLFTLGTGLIVGSVPPERAGSAASMSETGNYFGGSLGFALLGVAAAAVYRSRMDGTSDSLAGAVAASQHLPVSQGAELLHTAREAFTASLHVTGVVAAVIFAGLAVLILTMRPAAWTTPAVLPDYEACQDPDILRRRSHAGHRTRLHRPAGRDAAADFYQTRLGLRRAPASPPHAVVFATSPVPFAVRTPLPGIDLDAVTPRPGTGVALWLRADDAQQLHDDLAAAGEPIVAAPIDGPFGRTFTFRDPDGYAVTIHDQG